MTTIRTKPQDAMMQPDDGDVVLAVDQVSKKFCRDLRRSLFYGLQDIARREFSTTTR
jgi:lipopolysaccharide transport system ATP-binding protein